MAQETAKPKPVFPDVGSIIVQPGLRTPDASASSIIRYAILSFTEPPGLKNSNFATASQFFNICTSNVL